MPNCFSLTRKGETAPMPLQAIDDLMRKHFDAAPDAINWFNGWYDYIGFALACGRDMAWLETGIAKIISEAKDDDERAYWTMMQACRAWLADNFTSDAWAEIGKS